MINQVFNNGRFAQVTERSLDKPFREKSKPPLFIKNLHPLMILIIDYKILTSCLSARMKTVLPNLIDDEQVGFIPNQYNEENLMHIQSLIDFINDKS